MRCVKVFFSTAVALLFASYSSASTTVGGFISSNSTWSAAGNPYLAYQSIAVVEGAELTIEPGVEVRFSPLRSLLVLDGTLVARGTAESNILFTADQTPGTVQSNRWGYIGFSDEAVDVEVSTNGSYSSGSIVEHAVIEFAGGGDIKGAIHSEDCSLAIRKCRIRDNSKGGVAITLSPTPRDLAPFEDTVIQGETLGVTQSAISVYSGTLNSPSVVPGSLTISVGGYRFTDEGDGVLSGTSGTAGTIDYTYGIWSIDLVNGFVSDGSILMASYTHRFFVTVGHGGYSGAPVFIQNNRFERNTAPNGGAVAITASPGFPDSDGVFSTIYFAGNALISNTAVRGGGMFADSVWVLSLSSNVFTGNVATNGGAVFSEFAGGTLDGNLLIGNRAINGGGNVP